MAEPKFEKDLEKLEQTVEALEAGGLSLDDALKRFEEGIRLARRCEKALTEAERKIEVLMKNAQGEIGAEPFGDEGDEDSDSSSASELNRKSKPRDEGKSEEGKSEEEGGLLF
jgi:exodeoxyribonuclease VII small subunit